MQNDKNNKDSGLPSFFKDVGLPNTTAEEVERSNSYFPPLYLQR
jgi:hypothetical protein